MPGVTYERLNHVAIGTVSCPDCGRFFGLVTSDGRRPYKPDDAGGQCVTCRRIVAGLADEPRASDGVMGIRNNLDDEDAKGAHANARMAMEE